MFIMIDGIDGCGKSTIVKTWKKYLSSQGNGIFDLKHYIKESGQYPKIAELRAYDFVFSAEPTYAGMGKIIREELINKNYDYPPEAIAHAFSLDRLILYEKIIIPAIQNDRFIIQDRGIATSLVYHPTQSKKITLDFVLNLPGNKLALANRPDYLVLVDCTTANAAQRLTGRAHKTDDSIFEKTSFLKKIEKQYRSKTFLNIFKKRGTKILHLNGNAKIDIMKAEALVLIKTLIK